MYSCVSRLITVPPPSKQLCFRISSGIANQDTPDEKALLGNFFRFFSLFSRKVWPEKGFFTLVGQKAKKRDFPVDSK